MPSNKNKERMRKEAASAQHFELTGKNQMIYETVALMPKLENDEIIYSIVRIQFTDDKKLVSMEEIDKCRTQGTALVKVETAFINGTCNITQLRKVVRELKKEQSDE